MTIVSAASIARTTNSTRPSNITAGIAARQTTGVMNCLKPANAAGANAIAGGMRMATVGTAIATGTITTTIAIATKLNPQNRAVSRAQQITAALFLFILIPAFSSRRISFFQGRNIPRPQVFYEYRAQPITSPRDAREDTMFTNIFKSMLGKAVLAAAVIGGALCFAGAPNAQAGERD